MMKFFDCSGFVKPEMIAGDIPSNKAILKRTIDLALPSTIESVLISLIGAVDMMMVGTIGANAIASVGICNQPKFIILATILSLNVGVTVIVSHRKGEENPESANKTLGQAWLLSGTIAFILSSLGFIFAKDLVVFSGATGDYADMAAMYFRSIMVGNFFYSMSLTINAAQKGSGNTKIAMRTNVTANIVNVVMNFLLINGIGFFPKLGVLGAGIATSMGNCVAFIMSVYSLKDPNGFLHLKPRHFKFDIATLKSLFNIASSSFAEQVFLRIGFFTYSKTVAGLGMVAYATHNVCMQLMSLSFSFGDGLSVATSSLVGQSLGAKRKDMAIIYSKLTQRVGNVAGITLGLIMVTFRTQLISLFTTDPVIIQNGSNIVFIIAITMVFQITQVVTYGCLRSAGDVKFTAMLSLLSVTIIRPVLTWGFIHPLNWGLYGAWISLFLDQLARYFGSRWRHRQGNWLNHHI